MSDGNPLIDPDLEAAKQAIRDVMTDPMAQPAARAAAARTMLELLGALGKHSTAPVDPSRPTHELSRADLEAELAALEASSAADRST